jgi:hypothetical protein
MRPMVAEPQQRLPATPALPSWATTMVRIFLAWEALELVLVGLVAPLFYRDLAQSCRFWCELGAIYMVGGELVTIAVAIAAIALAVSLSARRVSPSLVAIVIGCALAGALIMLWDLLASTTVEGSRYMAYTFQFWAARPLMLWPSIGVILGLAAGMIASYGVWPRALRVGAPVAAALLSLYFLSYLLPATDVRVAGLHGLGIVQLPPGAGILTKTDGQRIVRDLDPFYFINNGSVGYLVLVSPGDYTVPEVCVQGFTVLGPAKALDVHVALGATAVVPDVCPH